MQLNDFSLILSEHSVLNIEGQIEATVTGSNMTNNALKKIPSYLLFAFVLIRLSISPISVEAGWEGVPPDADIKLKIQGGTDVRLLFDYGYQYPSQYRNSGSPTGWSPSHHRGIDFVRVRTPTVNSEVISSTGGKVVSAGIDRCDGGFVVVRTPHKVQVKSGAKKTAYVWYLHLGELAVRRGNSVERGSKIGTLSPTGKRCIGRVAHLHFALSTSNPDPNRETLNPNLYWANGPSKFTCYEPGMDVPEERLSITSPLPCEQNKERIAKIAALRPIYEKSILALPAVLETADRDLVKKWQIYFREFDHYKGPIDGVFGKNTERAIRKCSWDSACK